MREAVQFAVVDNRMTNNDRHTMRVACVSDVGLTRSLNEDSYHIDEALGLLLVADGMGGHDSGEVASHSVVSSIHEYLSRHGHATDDEATEMMDGASPEDSDSTWEDLPNPVIGTVTAALEYANEHLYQLNRDRGYPDGHGMGTTVAGLWRIGILDEAAIFHVGDSRLYLYRAGRLMLLTRDHTLYQQWVSSGRIGPAPSQNIILRSLGSSARVNPDVRLQSLQKGDLILICSDGLTSMVSDSRIKSALANAAPDALQATCESLVAQANAEGGKDNITVLLAWFK